MNLSGAAPILLLAPLLLGVTPLPAALAAGASPPCGDALCLDARDRLPVDVEEAAGRQGSGGKPAHTNGQGGGGGNGGGGGSPCPPQEGTVSGMWYYYLESARDPVVWGTYYHANWTYVTRYEPTPSGCVVIYHACDVAVNEGSLFHYLAFRSASSASGMYRQAPTLGGTLECTASGATLITAVAGLVPLNGHGFVL